MNESEIRTLMDSRSEAIRTKDIDRLMSFYSADIIYFDVVPPLQYVGYPNRWNAQDREQA
jgi:ketosteroid isomerase-like protein